MAHQASRLQSIAIDWFRLGGLSAAAAADGGVSGDYQAVTGFCHTLMIWSTITN